MGKLFEGIGQLVVGVNYILTCILVLGNFGLGWALLSFFIPPIGAVGAPFLVGTWPIFLIGSLIYIVGTSLTKNEDRKYAEMWMAQNKMQKSSQPFDDPTAEVSGKASAMRMLETDEIYGYGKLFGYQDGTLLWVGEDGTKFEIGNNISEWGTAIWDTTSGDLHFKTTSWNQFRIPKNESLKWRAWFEEHHPELSNS